MLVRVGIILGILAIVALMFAGAVLSAAYVTYKRNK